MWIIMLLLPVTLSFLQVQAQENSQVGPWVELEKKLQASENRVREIQEEMDVLLKRSGAFSDDEEKRKHAEALRSLKEEKRELERDIENLKRTLRYRFPERGLVFDSGRKGNTPSSAQESQNNKSQDNALPESSLKGLMNSIKQQYGVQLESPQSGDDSGVNKSPAKASPLAHPPDSVFAPLHISK